MELSRRALIASTLASAGAAGLGPRAAAEDDADDDGAEWEPLGRLRVTGAAEAVVSGETVYVATADGFAVADVSDPAAPELLAERRDLRIEDGELLDEVDDDSDGETGEDDSENDGDGPNGVDAGDEGESDGEGTTGRADDDSDGNDGPEPFTEILDLSVDGDRLVVPGPANPGQEGTFHGFVLYDVTEPAEPDPLAVYATDFHIHNTALHEGYCYLVGNDGERNPLVVLDVSDDEPREVGRWSLLDYDSRWEEVDPFLWYLHDVTLADDVAVLAYWNAGTYLVDVSDPAEPTYVGHVAETDISGQIEIPQADVSEAQRTLPGNDHHSRLAGDLLAVGREAWAAEEGDPEGSGGIDLYDAADPEGIEHLATIESPQTPDASYGGGEWTTAHNFSFQEEKLYASWYRGGVSVHDVSDPAEPAELTRWEDREQAAFWSAHAVGEVVVAPSTPLVPNAPTEGAVYTFPASLEDEGESEATADDGGESDGDEDDAGLTDGDEDHEDAVDDESDDEDTNADEAEGDGDEPAVETDADDGGGLSGLGLGAAIVGGAAAGGAAVLAWLRLRGSGGADEDRDRR